MALSPRANGLIYVAAWLGNGVKPEACGVCSEGSRATDRSYLSKSLPRVSLFTALCCRGGWEVTMYEQRCTAAVVGDFNHIRYRSPCRIRPQRHIER